MRNVIFALMLILISGSVMKTYAYAEMTQEERLKDNIAKRFGGRR